MTDSWSVPKPLGYLAALASAIVAIGGAWKLLDLPVPASRQWVQQVIDPYHEDAIDTRRRAVAMELFLWKSNHSTDPNILREIAKLESELAAIDRQIAARTR